MYKNFYLVKNLIQNGQEAKWQCWTLAGALCSWKTVMVKKPTPLLCSKKWLPAKKHILDLDKTGRWTACLFMTKPDRVQFLCHLKLLAPLSNWIKCPLTWLNHTWVSLPPVPELWLTTEHWNAERHLSQNPLQESADFRGKYFLINCLITPFTPSTCP